MEKEDKNNENRCHIENIKTINRNGVEDAVTDGSGDYVEQLFSSDA